MRTSTCCRLLRLRGDLGLRLRTSLAVAAERSVAALQHANATTSLTSSVDNDDVIGPSENERTRFVHLSCKRLQHANATTSFMDNYDAIRTSVDEDDVTGVARLSSKWSKPLRHGNHARMLHTAVAGTLVKSSSVDDDDVARFSRLSSEWWDESGAFKPLHSLNEARVPWIRDTLRPPSLKDDHGQSSLAGLRLLDIGCGAGVLSEPLARLGANVTGLDAGDDAITVARGRARQDPDLNKAKIKYECVSVEQFVAGDSKMVESFDAIIASEVIEHVASLESFLDACVQLAKPGAFLFFTTLNRTLLSRLMAIWLAEDVLGIVPRGVHDWSKFVPPDDLAALLEARGCTVRLVNGLCYNPLVNKWSWVGDTSVNYALMARKEG